MICIAVFSLVSFMKLDLPSGIRITPGVITGPAAVISDWYGHTGMGCKAANRAGRPPREARKLFSLSFLGLGIAFILHESCM